MESAGTLNRTLLELKHIVPVYDPALMDSLNRTLLELKQFPSLQELHVRSSQSYLIGIETW